MIQKKEIKRKRMLLYFIEATQKIIDEEGYEAVTLRRVADLAGYNSATLYSYFEDLEQLILYASLKYLRDYNNEANYILHSGKSERDKLLDMWQAFCKYSFQNPKPFAYIFSGKHKNNVEDIAAKYYDLYPEDIGTDIKELSTLLKSLKLEDRNQMILHRIAAEEGFEWKNLNTLNEMMVLLYRGLLEQKLQDKQEECTDKYVTKMMEYLRYVLSHAD